MREGLQRLIAALERPHRLGMIGGDLDAHLVHCEEFARVVSKIFGEAGPVSAVDLGTGGGLPGLALALRFPATRWTLIDRRAGRAAEVERAILRLEVAARVEVIIADAQSVGHDPPHREAAELVVARAFGPPSLTAECGSALLRLGGVLIVSEPPAKDAGRWPPEEVARCGFGPPDAVRRNRAQFVVLHKVTAVPAPLPRQPARADRGWP